MPSAQPYPCWLRCPTPTTGLGLSSLADGIFVEKDLRPPRAAPFARPLHRVRVVHRLRIVFVKRFSGLNATGKRLI